MENFQPGLTVDLPEKMFNYMSDFYTELKTKSTVKSRRKSSLFKLSAIVHTLNSAHAGNIERSAFIERFSNFYCTEIFSM